MQHNISAEKDNILIRPLNESDIEKLRIWRNDKTISKYLNVIPFITTEMQKEWYDNYILDKNTIFFAIVDKALNALIGSIALYDFKDGQCTVGRIVIGDTNSHGKGSGYTSLILAIEVAIVELSIQTIILNVHEENIAARKIYDKAGFKITGKHPFSNTGCELEMKIVAKDFLAFNSEVNEIVIHQNN